MPTDAFSRAAHLMQQSVREERTCYTADTEVAIWLAAACVKDGSIAAIGVSEDTLHYYRGTLHGYPWRVVVFGPYEILPRRPMEVKNAVG